ncbi:MAG: SHOCT domain-containing protein [Spirosoma sp.]|nr:SHOCT domain-containing protein [Spirosoma sp.]
MMNGTGWGMGGMGWGMWFIPLLIILAIYLFMKYNPQTKSGQATESPLDILRKRYAKGEVTKEQFEQMRKDI